MLMVSVRFRFWFNVKFNVRVRVIFRCSITVIDRVRVSFLLLLGLALRLG